MLVYCHCFLYLLLLLLAVCCTGAEFLLWLTFEVKHDFPQRSDKTIGLVCNRMKRKRWQGDKGNKTDTSSSLTFPVTAFFFFLFFFLISGVQPVRSGWDWRDPRRPHPRHEARIPQATAHQREPLRLLHVARATPPPRGPVLLASGGEVPQPSAQVSGADFRLHHGLVQPLAKGCSSCRYNTVEKILLFIV